jgi:hypothetical protein
MILSAMDELESRADQDQDFQTGCLTAVALMILGIAMFVALALHRWVRKLARRALAGATASIQLSIRQAG